MILIEDPRADPRSRWLVCWFPNHCHPFATKDDAISYMARLKFETLMFASTVLGVL